MIKTRKLGAGIAFAMASTISLAAFEPGAAAPFNRPKDVREIMAIENAMAGETNIDKVMPYYADGAILADITAPGWYVGSKQVDSAIEPQLAAVRTIKYRMDEISVASDGQFACAAMRIHFDVTRKDKSSVKMTIRQLDAFEKIGGRWRIVEQHASVPVDAKTGAAIFDGAPQARGALGWSDTADPGPVVPVEEAKTQISTWLAASEVPKSVDEMASFYGPGDDMIIYDFSSPRGIRGRRELHAYYDPQFVGVRNMEIKIPVVRVDTDGALGAQISQQDLKINMKDGTSHLVSFRQSDCVRRIGTAWYSVFEMGSFPIDEKTGKGIMLDPAGFR